ncbi:hypothetical protein, partial [Ferrovum sp.]|uniref:hypothetical protein n=1 Tax=Ferrovum sp. TaxID=2609467 RepID=UPI002620FD49
MNSNKIISAILKIYLFWYVVLLLIFPVNSPDWFLIALHDLWSGAQSLIVGGLTGVFVAVVGHITRTGYVAHALIGENDGDIRFSIGKIPAKRSWDRDEAAVCPEEFKSFLAGYKKSHPKHAALFEAGIKILAAYRHIPASVVPGGHGGASLETHSFNVLREALVLERSWVYKGQFTSSGYQTAAIQDKDYLFYPDPMIPLCALLHDIGKIECYRIIDGFPTEVKKRHDEEGSKMLAALPEFRALSKDDRNALSIAVGYYHHPGSIPLNQTDRPRALAVFTLEVDVKAGKKEGGYHEADIADDDASASTVTPAGQSPSRVEVQVQDEITASGAVTGILSDVLAEDQREQFSANRYYPVDVCTDALAVFITEYIKKPNFFGLKKDGKCFCQDMKMRSHLNAINRTRSFDDFHIHGDGKATKLTSFTLKVLWALHDRGMLVTTIENIGGTEQKFSPNTAVFDISGISLSGTERTTRFCLVFDAGVSPLLDEIEDCPNPFRIVKNSMGDQYRQDKGRAVKSSQNRKPGKGSKEGIDVFDFDPAMILGSVITPTMEIMVPESSQDKHDKPPEDATASSNTINAPETVTPDGLTGNGIITNQPKHEMERNNVSG